MLPKNHIPNFDIVRTNVVGRYVVLDPYMSGECRFSVCVGEKECVMKQANRADIASDTPSGSKTLPLSGRLVGATTDSYVKIGHRFYLVESVSEDHIVTETVDEPLPAGTKVELYSIPVDTSSEGKCLKVKFGVTTIFVDSVRMDIGEDTTPQDVLDKFSENILCWYDDRSGFLYFASSGYSTDTEYDNFVEFPIESRFLTLLSSVRVADGDDILLFNEDVSGNQTCRVMSCMGGMVWNGYKYTVRLDKLGGKFAYSQLRAYPAYFSRKLSIGSCGPFFADVCGATVFGEESEIVTRYTMYSGEEVINSVPVSAESFGNVSLRPSLMFLTSEMVVGSCLLELPNTTYVCDLEGNCSFRVRTGITGMYNIRFSSDETVLVSVTDPDGNIIDSGDNSKLFCISLGDVVVHIKGSPSAHVSLTYAESTDRVMNGLSYYVIARCRENSRCEVNGLHLNPAFRDYHELQAIIGKSKVGDGCVAI